MWVWQRTRWVPLMLVSMLLKEDVVMRMMVDLAPWSRSSIGFDRMFDMLENARRSERADNYPPYNIEKTSDDTYRITLAVAGFSPAELSITSQPNELIVAGKKDENGSGHYFYRGIADRAFSRRFSLADYVRVAGANLNGGLLSIDLVREVPEAMKPRRIEIANSNQPQSEAIATKVAA
jgi:molecular chaperone IbpA